MKTILIDTSLLVECAQHKIDLHTELTRILDFSFTVGILDRTLDELETIINRGGKEGAAAKLAKTILMTKRVTIYPTSGGHTDYLLLQRANLETIVATVDRDLKARLKKKGQPVIVIRAKKMLELVGA